MPDLNFSIDLHRHPQYKAFARAHKTDGLPPEPQSLSPANRSSLWYYDPPSLADKLLNIFFERDQILTNKFYCIALWTITRYGTGNGLH